MQDKTVYVKIGKNIRKYRLLKGLSQERLSEIISANDKFIGHVERVERTPSLKKLIKIAQILGTDIKNLFD
ncbi:MAG: helix-turn-helix transcriptional regulator [Candidatus Gastranaerophilales bacterium]|nr:helix-turn-helix transcriptional regulator [Candidatus Gastranaerophilales bacterium]